MWKRKGKNFVFGSNIVVLVAPPDWLAGRVLFFLLAPPSPPLPLPLHTSSIPLLDRGFRGKCVLAGLAE